MTEKEIDKHLKAFMKATGFKTLVVVGRDANGLRTAFSPDMTSEEALGLMHVGKLAMEIALVTVAKEVLDA